MPLVRKEHTGVKIIDRYFFVVSRVVYLPMGYVYGKKVIRKTMPWL